MAPTKDPRFARLSTDPRFLRPSKASQKVVLDDRFKSVLEGGADDATSSKVDKRGKKVAKGGVGKNLKAIYRTAGEKGQSSALDRARGEGLLESSSEEEDDSEEDNDEDEENKGEEDESDSDNSSSEGEEVILGTKQAKKSAGRREEREVSIDLDEDDPIASTSALADAQVESNIPTMEESTKRIAVVNLDWDNVRAIDLYKVFDSVLSSSATSLQSGTSLGSRKSKTKIAKGAVTKVEIFPSDFGKQRMAREEKEGPPIAIFSKNAKKAAPAATVLKKKMQSKGKRAAFEADDDEDYISDDDDGNESEEYDEVALRRYQLERLRYYYAVIHFDTVSAAQHAYDEIDATEFEATANVFDLRYVPDEVTFDDEPSDSATSQTVELQAYKPGEFVTDALRNSKVKLTWDADDPQRQKLMRSAHPSKDKKQKGKSKEDDVDYSALLASDSEDDAERRKRVRAAFGLGDAPAEDMEGDDSDEGGEREDGMEVTFGPALSENGLDEEEGNKEENSLDTYQRKERERRERKKEKRRAEKKKLSSRGRVVDGDEESDPDEAFDANAMGEADGIDSDAGDAFFEGEEQSSGEDDKTSSKVTKRAAKQLAKDADAKEAARLELLVGDENDSEGDGKHFDMQAILRAEKASGKPKKMLKKGKDRRKHEEATKLLEREKDRFEVDVQDDRFRNLHEDHEFALDPSSAKFLKTKNMQKLLDESRRRRDSKQTDNNGSSSANRDGTSSKSAQDGLASLVESIKRKNQSQGGSKDGKNKHKKQKLADRD